MAGKKKPVLSIESLTVDFDLGKTCHAVRDTSVCIEPGEMVALDRISNAPYQCGTSLHPISEVANLEKKVPLEWINADHTAMTKEFISYAMPLIQAELTPIYVEGLPHHIYLPEA